MNTHLRKDVHDIYRRLDEQVAGLGQFCRACGQCCDFERFGHRLYVTTPELLHFNHFVGPDIKEMTTGVCPYRIDGQCGVYPYRFSGCRIFQCKGDEEKQNALSEQAIARFKAICVKHEIPYQYVYLKAGMEMLRKGELKTANYEL